MSDLEFWEARYNVDHYHFGTEPNAFLKRNASAIAPGSRVLCIADGEGRNGVWLAGQGFQVTSQDFSPSAQEKASKLAKERGVTVAFERSDILERVWEPAAFDAVVGIFFQFLSPRNRTRVFEGIRSTVKPGGRVLVEGYGTKQMEYGTGGPRVLENLYTPELLREAFAGSAELEVTAYDAEIKEGRGHAGLSALIDMVARA